MSAPLGANDCTNPGVARRGDPILRGAGTADARYGCSPAQLDPIFTAIAATVAAALALLVASPVRAQGSQLLPSEVPAPTRATIARLAAPRSLTEVRIEGERGAGSAGTYAVELSVGGKQVEVEVNGRGDVVGRRSKEQVDLAKVPRAVRASVRRELGAAASRVEKATVLTRASSVTYVVDVETSEAELDLRMNPAGRVIEKREELTRGAVPPAILVAIRREAGAARIREVTRITTGGRIVYRADCDTRQSEIALRFSRSGKLLGQERRDKPLLANILPPPQPVAATAVTSTVPPPSAIPRGQSFVVAAAGDVAEHGQRQDLTADLLTRLRERKGLAGVLVLGDLQYPKGDLEDFMIDYDPTWGQSWLKAITRPAPGNHEYDQGRSNAEGYFDYFNGPGQTRGIAGERDKGYYSFDMGDWHFIALNTSDGCRGKISCSAGAPMYEWLVADLRRTDKKCVLAYAHHPRFQHGGVHEDNARVAPLWNALVDEQAELVLSGHEHNFQQLAPLDKQGNVDHARGLRSFVIGTGGADAYDEWVPTLHPEAVETTIAGRFGILELTLEPAAYLWRFVAADGSPDGESLAHGRGVCR